MAMSKRHIELQRMCRTWIKNRSFKICGIPEFTKIGYIADYVAIVGMQDVYHSRYAKKAGLEKMSMITRYRRDQNQCLQEITGDIDRWYVCVFEVKVSRSDFLNTFSDKDSSHARARMDPVGTAHWVVAEKGICKQDELPDFWGLLEPYGAGLTEKKMPIVQAMKQSEIHAIAFDMLFEQMNYRTSYYEQLHGMSDAVGAIRTAILRGKSKEEVLASVNNAREACRGMQR